MRNNHVVTTQPWLQQPNESDTGYAYFCTFRDMPRAKRRVAAVADHHNATLRTVQGHCTRWKWRDRARAYDAFVDVASATDDALDLSSERADLQRRGIELTRSALKLSQSVLNQIEPTDIGRQEAALLRTIVSTFGKLALPDEVTDNGVTVPLTTEYVDERMRKLAVEAASRVD